MSTVILVLALILLVIFFVVIWKYNYNILDSIAFLCLIFLLGMILLALLFIIEDSKSKPDGIGVVNSGPIISVLIFIALLYLIFWGFFTLANKYIKPNTI